MRNYWPQANRSQASLLGKDVSILTEYQKYAQSEKTNRGSSILSSATGHSDQNSHTYGDCQCDEWTFFGLSPNLLYRVAAELATDFDGLVPKASCLIDGHALATTEAIYNFAQDGHDRVYNLISRCSRASGRASAGALSNSTRLLFDCA
jgi:hypothetical protein